MSNTPRWTQEDVIAARNADLGATWEADYPRGVHTLTEAQPVLGVVQRAFPRDTWPGKPGVGGDVSAA